MAVKRPMSAKRPAAHKPLKKPERELKRLANATKRAKVASKQPSGTPSVVSSRVEPVVVAKEAPIIEAPLVTPPVPAAPEIPQEDAQESQEEEPEEKLSVGRSFVIGDAIEFGWKSVKSRFWFFISIMLLFAILSLIAGQVTGIGSKIVLNLLVFGLNAGFARLALDVVEGKQAEFKELFSCFGVLHWFIIGSILYTLIVAAGLLLLIVPGIIWMLAFSQWLFALVDTKSNPIAALRRSVALTEGVKGKIFVFWLALFGLNLLGAVALGIGLLVTIPLTLIASAHVYDQLRKSA